MHQIKKDFVEKMLQDAIDQNGGKMPDMETLNRLVNGQMEKLNTLPEDDFEGYSPVEMQHLLYHLYNSDTPVRLNDLKPEDCLQSPLFKQAKHLIECLLKEERIKLTAIGNLPRQLVKELYSLGVPEEMIDKGITKLSKETDSESVQMVHVLLKLSKVVKEQHKVMTLTKAGREMAADDNRLIRELMLAFSLKYNLAYLDGYHSEEIGCVGIGFTLVLLNKYGDEQRSARFYAEKYFKAFPMLLQSCDSHYRSPLDEGTSCYSIRVFERFLWKMGLIEYSRYWENQKEYIELKKAPLFDRWIRVVAPGFS